ncbi:amidase [Bacillus sp. AFS040349]|uniref:amidase n=1 Tax=Bacillus sp. AFS040349 TaxID=2033502 RepID=UPI000BFE9E5E|nr:amidase [Bacillus sp. AFS040349]PGT76579.1 amidase [Bacillus sp. AFS040349]
MDQLKWLDATEQAHLIRTKQITTAELLSHTIDLIEEKNQKLNTVTHKLYGEISPSIQSGPFSGVPFLMKDLEFFANTPYTAGSTYLKDFIAPADSEYSSRIRHQTGLITIGKTNTCEFGLVPTTEPTQYGPTRNPWNLAYTAGGSSGGAAAAVAAGIVSMAHASDGGGSIRIPASCCGVFGLKVSRGRNPKNPDPVGLGVNHVMTRTVRDSAGLLDATYGNNPGDPFYLSQPSKSFVAQTTKKPRKLKIAVLKTGFNGKKIHLDCEDAVLDAANLCQSLGHNLEEASPTINVEQYNRAFQVLWQSSFAQGIHSLTKLTGRAPKQEELEPYTWEVFHHGDSYKATDYLSALSYMQQVSKEVAHFFNNFDLLLTPTLSEPPLRIGELTYKGNLNEYVNRLNEWVPYTPLANTTGCPAMSVPLFWNKENLPIGVHFMAPLGDEATLFQLAGQLEQARPWKDKKPTTI